MFNRVKLSRIKKKLKNYIFTKKAYKFYISDWHYLSDLKSAAQLLSTMRFSRQMEPLLLDRPDGEKILCIAPHPDDESIGAGGTLLKSIHRGAEVLVVYLTSGQLSVKQHLHRDAVRVSSYAGYNIKFIHNEPKKILQDTLIEKKLAHIINAFKPDTLFLPFILDDHDDHRCASYLFSQMLKKKLIDDVFEVWAYQVYSTVLPNVVVDITNEIKDKTSLIQMWETQNKTRNWSHYAQGLNAYNQRFLPNEPYEQYAELFFVLPAGAYLNYCDIYFSEPANCFYAKAYRSHFSKNEGIEEGIW